MTLKDDLQEIDGVGEKTAEKILSVVEDHNTGLDESTLNRALTALDNNRPNVAREYLEDL